MRSEFAQTNRLKQNVNLLNVVTGTLHGQDFSLLIFNDHLSLWRYFELSCLAKKK